MNLHKCVENSVATLTKQCTGYNSMDRVFKGKTFKQPISRFTLMARHLWLRLWPRVAEFMFRDIKMFFLNLESGLLLSSCPE